MLNIERYDEDVKSRCGRDYLERSDKSCNSRAAGPDGGSKGASGSPPEVVNAPASPQGGEGEKYPCGSFVKLGVC